MLPSPSPPLVIYLNNSSLLDFAATRLAKSILIAFALLVLPIGQALAADINVDSSCTLAQAINEANGETSDVGSCEAGTDGSGAPGADRILLAANVDLPANTVLPQITSHVTITTDDNSIQRRINNTYIETTADSHLTFERVNISRGGRSSPAKASLELGGPAIIRHVLISGSWNTGIRGSGEDADYEISELVIYNTAPNWSWPNAIWAVAGRFTITDLVVAQMFGSLSLFRINEGASITLQGCKAVFDTATKRVWGSGRFRDNSDSVCQPPTADFGHRAPPALAAPDALSCGFPDARFMNLPDNIGTLTYTLNADCTISQTLVVPDGATVVIRSPAGQRYSITMTTNNPLFLSVSGTLTLRNVEVIAPTDPSVLRWFIRVQPTGKLLIENSLIRPDAAAGVRPAVINRSGEISLNRATIQGFRVNNAGFASAIINWAAGKVMIRDSTIRDNTGGIGAIGIYHDFGGHLFLLRSNTFTGNTPRDIYDPHGLLCEGEGCLPPPPIVEKASAGESGPPPPKATAIPKPPTCLTLPAHIRVTNITQSTQCRQVGREGIGNDQVLAAGFRDGVDIWGWVLPDTQVCFAGTSGSFRFLDAATMPRAVSELPAVGMDGMICTTINRAGTVALMQGPPAPLAAVPTPATSAQSLSGCMVRTKYMLNFRDAPAGEVIGGVPYDVTLTALERTVGWFKVDYHGTRGWLAAMYVEPIGNCG